METGVVPAQLAQFAQGGVAGDLQTQVISSMVIIYV